jgi:hypothetical protein
MFHRWKNILYLQRFSGKGRPIMPLIISGTNVHQNGDGGSDLRSATLTTWQQVPLSSAKKRISQKITNA